MKLKQVEKKISSDFWGCGMQDIGSTYALSKTGSLFWAKFPEFDENQTQGFSYYLINN